VSKYNVLAISITSWENVLAPIADRFSMPNESRQVLILSLAPKLPCLPRAIHSWRPPRRWRNLGKARNLDRWRYLVQTGGQSWLAYGPQTSSVYVALSLVGSAFLTCLFSQSLNSAYLIFPTGFSKQFRGFQPPLSQPVRRGTLLHSSPLKLHPSDTVHIIRIQQIPPG